MSESVFEELKRYVGFGPGDEEALRALYPHAQPRFVEVARVFYDRILEHEGARTALVGGESVVGRLKITLVQWMDKLLTGPWDEEYYQVRCRIGRVHVRIGLPQHYMFGAMNVVRQQLISIADETWPSNEARHREVLLAVGKVLDLELAVMLHTYREDLLDQQARKERLATFGQLVGSIGHELRNPLGVMETSLYILKQRLGDDPRAVKHAERIGEQLGIANHIIADLLDLIRDRPLTREQVDVHELIERVATTIPHPEKVSLVVDDPGRRPLVAGDPVQLRQVFVNLLDNAVQASGEAGEVRVTFEGTNPLEIAVEDTGPGVDPAISRRLFEPLVTTKAKGVGLGLALVRRVVERHGGTVALEPKSRGARFVVRLPVV
jgi:two-component system sensor histidine kinase HydH